MWNQSNSTFIPSRDLAVLKLKPNATSISKGLSSISKALGQNDSIICFSDSQSSESTHSSQLVDFEPRETERDSSKSDQTFELRYSTAWLTSLVARPLRWLERHEEEQDPTEINSDERTSSVEEIVDQAAELLALFSGKSASGPSTRIYYFPVQSNDVLVNLRDTTLVSDALGGRTWGAAPLLTVELLKSAIKSDSKEPLNILELGAGTGLVGLALAEWLSSTELSSKVILTDYHPNVMSNLEHNARLNGWLGSKKNGETTESKETNSELLNFVCKDRFGSDSRVKLEVNHLDWQEIHLEVSEGDERGTQDGKGYVSTAQTLPVQVKQNQIEGVRSQDKNSQEIPQSDDYHLPNRLNSEAKFDLLIAADCIYDPYHPQWIKSVATRHLSNPISSNSSSIHPIESPTNQTTTPSSDSQIKSPNLRTALHILSPLRDTHKVEIEAIYQAFPKHFSSNALEDDQELELKITLEKDLEGYDDFGAPNLDFGVEVVEGGRRKEEIGIGIEEMLKKEKERAIRKEESKRRDGEVRMYRWFVVEWK